MVTLSPGANKADVSALLQDPKSNQPASRITITPAEYFADKMFPAGTTTLTYVATNENGKTAQCQAAIIVQGIFFFNIKYYRLSHDVVTCDVDRDVSTA